ALSGTGEKARHGSPTPGGSILTTSAPKSERMVAAAGPAIQLAQSITFRCANRLWSIVAFLPLHAAHGLHARPPASPSSAVRRAGRGPRPRADGALHAGRQTGYGRR